MKESFISLVAGHILSRPDIELKDLAVVFPNRRAGNLFRQELVRRIPHPVWSPGIFSIDDWLTGLSGLRRTDHLTELALLFPAARQHLPFLTDFDDFIDFGEILLADFEDVDKYLADPASLFSNITAVKQIESRFDPFEDEDLAHRLSLFWGSFAKVRSKHQDRWLETWENLHPVYRDFTAELAGKGLGTAGMCYRKAAEDLPAGKTTIGRFRHLAFAGFNILTGAEERIFNYLKDSELATFYWDCHPYYMDGRNEAGRFLMSYVNRFPQPGGFDPFPREDAGFFNTGNEHASLVVSPVTSNTGQLQMLLNGLLNEKSENCGVILSDENLFPDLLTSWPDELPVNFTSGYPLNDTLSAGLILSLVDIFAGFHIPDSHGECPLDLITGFVKHPWAGWLAGEDPSEGIRQMERRFSGPVPAAYLDQHAVWKPWLGHLDSNRSLLERIIRITTRLSSYDKEYYPIERGALEDLKSEAERLLGELEVLGLELDPATLAALIRRYVRTAKVSLETDREAAVQVTGILETRLVDFDEVHILSFNEGVWPSAKLSGSLIPYPVRRMFNLPTAESRDAMYAYYFYRMVQRASRVNIYYLTGHRDDRIRSGERSRYLIQLQFAFPGRIRVVQEPPVKIGLPSQPLEIRKEGAVRDILDRYLAGHPRHRRLSPSALNEYIDCGLRFALKRIYDLREPDEVAYASDSKGFGILVHQVMNRLYHGFLQSGETPSQEWYVRVMAGKPELKRIIREEYEKILDAGEPASPGGKDLLAMEVVTQYVLSILDLDHREHPARIVALEKEYELEFPVRTASGEGRVTLYGYIDRVDELAGRYRVIDYKTGKCDLNARDVESLFNPEGGSSRPKEILQVLWYCELFRQNAGQEMDLIPCLFRLGQFRAGESAYRLTLAGQESGYEEWRASFTDGLGRVLGEMFDPEVPFRAAADDKVCRYCHFKSVCSGTR